MTVSIASESSLLESLSLEDTVQHILETRRITRIDQQRLMQFGMASLNNQNAIQLVNKVSEALRVGRLRVID
ncbi:MAG: hypothetical protein AAFR31_02820 [Cyanobacteria bacterium J06627_8]